MPPQIFKRPLWILSVLGIVGFSPARLFAADVLLDAVLKLQHFQQPSSSAPAISPTNGYSFQAFVIASTNNSVTGAVVRLPNSTTKTLAQETSIDLRFEEYFNTPAALDAAYPGGGLSGYTYQMQMKTVNDGARSNNCAYLGLFLATYPTTPQIAAANWTAAQTIDHTRGFTLQWNNLGGNTVDVVQVLVEQNVTNIFYNSPLPFTSGALNGASTSVVIPGYTLPPGTNLTGHLIVIHVAGLPDTNTYAAGVALMGKETVFPVQTRPTPPLPVLTLLSRTNAQTQLTLTGETNRTYQIQATENWTNWQTLLTTNSTSGKFFFADGLATNLAARFYRGRVGD